MQITTHHLSIQPTLPIEPGIIFSPKEKTAFQAWEPKGSVEYLKRIEAVEDTTITLKPNVKDLFIPEGTIVSGLEFKVKDLRLFLEHVLSDLLQEPVECWMGGGAAHPANLPYHDIDYKVYIQNAHFQLIDQTILKFIRNLKGCPDVSDYLLYKIYYSGRTIFPDQSGAYYGLQTVSFNFFVYPDYHCTSPADGVQVSPSRGKIRFAHGKDFFQDEEGAKWAEKCCFTRDYRVFEPEGIKDFLLRLLFKCSQGHLIHNELWGIAIKNFMKEYDFFKFKEKFSHHLENHFPHAQGKLIDVFNLLSLFQYHPTLCTRVAQALLEIRDKIGLTDELVFVDLILDCEKQGKHITPLLLSFLRGIFFFEWAQQQKGQEGRLSAYTFSFMSSQELYRLQIGLQVEDHTYFLALPMPGSPVHLASDFIHAHPKLLEFINKCSKNGLQLLKNTFTCLGFDLKYLTEDVSFIEKTILSSFDLEHVRDCLKHQFNDHYDPSVLFSYLKQKGCDPSHQTIISQKLALSNLEKGCKPFEQDKKLQRILGLVKKGVDGLTEKELCEFVSLICFVIHNETFLKCGIVHLFNSSLIELLPTIFNNLLKNASPILLQHYEALYFTLKSIGILLPKQDQSLMEILLSAFIQIKDTSRSFIEWRCKRIVEALESGLIQSKSLFESCVKSLIESKNPHYLLQAFKYIEAVEKDFSEDLNRLVTSATNFEIYELDLISARTLIKIVIKYPNIWQVFITKFHFNKTFQNVFEEILLFKLIFLLKSKKNINRSGKQLHSLIKAFIQINQENPILVKELESISQMNFIENRADIVEKMVQMIQEHYPFIIAKIPFAKKRIDSNSEKNEQTEQSSSKSFIGRQMDRSANFYFTIQAVDELQMIAQSIDSYSRTNASHLHKYITRSLNKRAEAVKDLDKENKEKLGNAFHQAILALCNRTVLHALMIAHSLHNQAQQFGLHNKQQNAHTSFILLKSYVKIDISHIAIEEVSALFKLIESVLQVTKLSDSNSAATLLASFKMIYKKCTIEQIKFLQVHLFGALNDPLEKPIRKEIIQTIALLIQECLKSDESYLFGISMFHLLLSGMDVTEWTQEIKSCFLNSVETFSTKKKFFAKPSSELETFLRIIQEKNILSFLSNEDKLSFLKYIQMTNKDTMQKVILEMISQITGEKDKRQVLFTLPCYLLKSCEEKTEIEMYKKSAEILGFQRENLLLALESEEQKAILNDYLIRIYAKSLDPARLIQACEIFLQGPLIPEAIQLGLYLLEAFTEYPESVFNSMTIQYPEKVLEKIYSYCKEDSEKLSQVNQKLFAIIPQLINAESHDHFNVVMSLLACYMQKTKLKADLTSVVEQLFSFCQGAPGLKFFKYAHESIEFIKKNGRAPTKLCQRLNPLFIEKHEKLLAKFKGLEKFNPIAKKFFVQFAATNFKQIIAVYAVLSPKLGRQFVSEFYGKFIYFLNKYSEADVEVGESCTDAILESNIYKVKSRDLSSSQSQVDQELVNVIRTIDRWLGFSTEPKAFAFSIKCLKIVEPLIQRVEHTFHNYNFHTDCYQKIAVGLVARSLIEGNVDQFEKFLKELKQRTHESIAKKDPDRMKAYFISLFNISMISFLVPLLVRAISEADQNLLNSTKPSFERIQKLAASSPQTLIAMVKSTNIFKEKRFSFLEHENVDWMSYDLVPAVHLLVKLCKNQDDFEKAYGDKSIIQVFDRCGLTLLDFMETTLKSVKENTQAPFNLYQYITNCIYFVWSVALNVVINSPVDYDNLSNYVIRLDSLRSKITSVKNEVTARLKAEYKKEIKEIDESRQVKKKAKNKRKKQKKPTV